MINTIQNTIQSTIQNTLGDLDVSAFDMLNLFSSGQRGAWYDPSDLSTMYQVDESITSLFVPVGSDKFVTSDGLNFMTKSGVPVTADGQPVGLIQDKSGNALNALQPVSTQRPTYNATPDRLTLDLVDDSLAFTVPTGGIDGYMVVGTNEGTASYGVSLPAGDYDIGGDFFMGGSVNGFLLREGAVSAADLSNVEKNFVSKGAKASYGDVTDFSNYWQNKDITDFPLIDTSSGIYFIFTWRDNNLTSFPLIDTSNVVSFYATWQDNNLTSFPLIDTSSGTSFANAWYVNNLTSFPLLDTSSGIDFASAWRNNNLTSFPLIDTSSGTSFRETWANNNLTSFPLINTSNVTSFYFAWINNNLTSFPLIDTSSGTNFYGTWANNNALADFPANMFNNCLATNFTYAFLSTGLTQESIDGILVSISSNGTSNGTFDQSGGSAPSATGEAAIDAMRSRGWTITVTGGY